MNITLSPELLALVDSWREETGLGRSAAVEFLLRAYLGTPQESPLATTSAADPVDDEGFEAEVDFSEEDDSEADAPDDAEEATGSSTPASSGDTP